MNNPLSIEEFKEALDEEILFYENSNDPIPEINKDSLDKIQSYLQMPFQTGFGKDLYPDIYDKASILCYLIIKNHALSNGNKRMGIISMVLFLDKNKIPYKKIAAYDLAKYIASSDSQDKDEVLSYIKEKIIPMKNNKKEIAQLKKIINDPKTTEEEKKRFQAIVDKIEGQPAPEEKVTKATEVKTIKPAAPKKKKAVAQSTYVGKKDHPSCDELLVKFKEAKKARLIRQKARKDDTRKPETKLRDQADKQVSDIVNKLMKLSKKNQLSGRVKKDVMEILREGISHVNKLQ